MHDRHAPHAITGPEGEAAARARLDALFARFNTLTPDELGRIGLRRAEPAERARLSEAVEAAARATDRAALLGEARAEARDTVMRRYSAGTLHPTWVGLNWGISQGTTEDRVAIVEALSDAAAAAVVEDALTPDVAEALSLDAEHILGLAEGDAYDGALGRAIEPPPPGLPDRRGRIGAVVVGAIAVGIVTAGGAAIVLDAPISIAAGIVTGLIVVALGRRRPDEVADPSGGGGA
jgi:hypothetical protein